MELFLELNSRKDENMDIGEMQSLVRECRYSVARKPQPYFRHTPSLQTEENKNKAEPIQHTPSIVARLEILAVLEVEPTPQKSNEG